MLTSAYVGWNIAQGNFSYKKELNRDTGAMNNFDDLRALVDRCIIAYVVEFFACVAACLAVYFSVVEGEEFAAWPDWAQGVVIGTAAAAVVALFAVGGLREKMTDYVATHRAVMGISYDDD